MNKFMVKSLLSTLFAIMALGVLVSCGGSSHSNSETTGTLSVAMTDAATDNYKAVYVTIDRIDVYSEEEEGDDTGTWSTVAEPGETYDLLTLVNGVFADLGQDLLETGTYGQLRLIIGEAPENEVNLLGNEHPYANYVIAMDDNAHELKVPSGPQTGIKIIHGFEIFPGQMTELILDFDASRSVVKAGSSGQYLLKPTIKVLEVTNLADIFGTVSEEDSEVNVPIAGAYVAAQTSDDDAEMVTDQVVIETGTMTSETGEYALVLDPGAYNIVVTASGYEAACSTIVKGEDEVASEINFSLAPLSGPMGNISGSIIFPPVLEGEDVPFATISVRQDLTCGESTETVITQTNLIAAGGTYEFSVPAGDYTIVATSEGYDSISEVISVDSEGNVSVNPLDFEFTAL